MRNGVVLQHMHGLYMENTCEIFGNIIGDMGDVCHDILVYPPLPAELYACMLRVSQATDHNNVHLLACDTCGHRISEKYGWPILDKGMNP